MLCKDYIKPRFLAFVKCKCIVPSGSFLNAGCSNTCTKLFISASLCKYLKCKMVRFILLQGVCHKFGILNAFEILESCIPW